jgi:hypothetical protein
MAESDNRRFVVVDFDDLTQTTGRTAGLQGHQRFDHWIHTPGFALHFMGIRMQWCCRAQG